MSPDSQPCALTEFSSTYVKETEISLYLKKTQVLPPPLQMEGQSGHWTDYSQVKPRLSSAKSSKNWSPCIQRPIFSTEFSGLHTELCRQEIGNQKLSLHVAQNSLDRTEAAFGTRTCWWRSQAVYSRKHNVQLTVTSFSSVILYWRKTRAHSVFLSLWFLRVLLLPASSCISCSPAWETIRLQLQEGGGRERQQEYRLIEQKAH